MAEAMRSFANPPATHGKPRNVVYVRAADVPAAPRHSLIVVVGGRRRGHDVRGWVIGGATRELPNARPSEMLAAALPEAVGLRGAMVRRTTSQATT